MAYVTTNPPFKVAGDLENLWALWVYRSTDASTVVDADGYFTDGFDLGMRKGHTVIVIDTDAAAIAQTMHIVSVATAATVDLSDGVAIGSTNSD